MLENNVKSIAFPCISTGHFKYDNEKAAKVALNAVRTWLQDNHANVEQIVFCTHHTTVLYHIRHTIVL